MATNRTISLYENNGGVLYMVSSDCDEAVVGMEFSEASFAEDAAGWNDWHNDASEHCPAQDAIDDAERSSAGRNDGMVLIATFEDGKVERINEGGSAARKYMGDAEKD